MATSAICAKCHRIWVSDDAETVCKWCGRRSHRIEPAISHYRADRPRREHKTPTELPVGTGYDQIDPSDGWLECGDHFHMAHIEWATLYNVASYYAKRAKAQEQEDLLHDIMIELAHVIARKQSQGEEFSITAMHRTAEHIKDGYWHKQYAYTNGLDCRHCTKEQRAKCRYNWAHSDWAYADCHRAIQLESLNQPVTDGDGNMTELGELLADDTATDLDAWVDARTFLIGAPVRLKRIVKAMYDGEPLGHKDRDYLYKLRRKSQKPLF